MIRFYRTTLLGALVFLSTLQAYTQPIQITGQVIHAKTGAPVPFANVAIVGKPLGTVTNEDGQFILRIPQSLAQDSLAISFVGFFPKRYLVQTASRQPLTVMLQPNAVQLREVVVIPEDPRKIVEKVYANIPKNYFTEPVQYSGFYREWTRNPDEGRLKEALLHIYSETHDPSEEEAVYQVKLERGRVFEFLEEAEQGVQVTEGITGIHRATKSEPIRRVPSFMHGKDMKKYEYRLSGFLLLNDSTEVFVIEFDQLEKINDPLFKGVMWITTDTYALVKLKFGFSPHGNTNKLIPFAARALVRMFGFKLDVNALDLVYDYAPYGNKWYLQRSSVLADILFHRPKKDQSFPINVTSDFTTQQLIIEGATPFPETEVMTKTTPLDTAKTLYDPLYWEGYSYVAPSSKVQAMLEKFTQEKSEGKRDEE